MTPTETAAILRQFNEWRRGNLEGMPQPDPREIGEAIDAAVEMIERLEAAEKEVGSWKGLAQQFGNEADELRAKVAEMRQQEPVASVWRCDNGHIHGSCERTLPMGTKLYLAPGAQPAPIISEGWPTDEMTTAFAAVFSVRDQQATFAPAFRAALAAAPEAKP